MVAALSAWWFPLLVFILVLCCSWILRGVFAHLLKRWAEKAGNDQIYLVLRAVRFPSVFWIFILAMLQIPEVRGFPEPFLHFANKLLVSLLIISLTLVSARLVTDFAQSYGAEKPREGTLRPTGLTQTVARWSVFILGFLLLLDAVGINITPVLTALGIGGLAVALALQDTLSNLFAGLNVTFARQVQVGQHIRLESGQEGDVIDIGWRTTTLRSAMNVMVVIPNSKIAQSIVTNYSMPEASVNFTMNVRAGYGSDPNQVERILQEECDKAIRELPGFIKSFAPLVRLQEFGEWSLNFLLTLQAESHDAQFRISGELYKRILIRFRQEGIEIPFPTRTVYRIPPPPP